MADLEESEGEVDLAEVEAAAGAAGGGVGLVAAGGDVVHNVWLEQVVLVDGVGGSLQHTLAVLHNAGRIGEHARVQRLRTARGEDCLQRAAAELCAAVKARSRLVMWARLISVRCRGRGQRGEPHGTPTGQQLCGCTSSCGPSVRRLEG